MMLRSLRPMEDGSPIKKSIRTTDRTSNLRQFPSGRRVRVSDGGGVHSRWRPDGKELFYIAPNGR